MIKILFIFKKHAKFLYSADSIEVLRLLSGRRETCLACIQHGFLDQQCDVLLRKTYVEGALIIICYPPENGSKVDLGKIQPWF